MQAALLMLLVAILAGPPLVLWKYKHQLGWGTRYAVGLIPVAYTGAGRYLAQCAYSYLACQGGIKNLHGCSLHGMDATMLVGYGYFIGLIAIFVAAPLSAWLVLSTARRQVSAMTMRGLP